MWKPKLEIKGREYQPFISTSGWDGEVNFGFYIIYDRLIDGSYCIGFNLGHWIVEIGVKEPEA